LSRDFGSDGLIQIKFGPPQRYQKVDVSFGSISEVGQAKRHVRFPPDSDQTADIAGGPVRANMRHSK
jgi:hypothetical protein